MAISYYDPKQRGLHSTRWNGVVKGKALGAETPEPGLFGWHVQINEEKHMYNVHNKMDPVTNV